MLPMKKHESLRMKKHESLRKYLGNIVNLIKLAKAAFFTKNGQDVVLPCEWTLKQQE